MYTCVCPDYEEFICLHIFCVLCNVWFVKCTFNWYNQYVSDANYGIKLIVNNFSNLYIEVELLGEITKKKDFN